MLTVGSLFSGIGGLDLGLERAGMVCKWQAEIDPYAVRVLEKHWPNVKRYGDVRKVDWTQAEPVDLVCAGFPCQPFSVAGKRGGESDNRFLWPEVARCLRETRPRYALLENVPGLLSVDRGRVFGRILADLACIGYDAEWGVLSAADMGAPHLRKRVFIVAHAAAENGWVGNGTVIRGEVSTGVRSGTQHGGSRPVERRLGGVADGLPEGLHGPWGPGWEDGTPRVVKGQRDRVNRLRCLGNAVVPACAGWVGRHILAMEVLEQVNAAKEKP